MTHTVRTLTLPCGRCDGHGSTWSESPPVSIPCPVCAGTGRENMPATDHLLAYLGGATSFRELVERLDLAAGEADARARTLCAGDREQQNLATLEAAVLAAARQALYALLAPLWAQGEALRSSKGRTPRPRGVQAFVPPRKG